MIKVRPLKEQCRIADEILKLRLDSVLKDAMAETGIDTWLIPSKEYCEDPMFNLLTPAMFLTARRISILILHYDGSKVNKYCCNNPDELLEEFYENVYKDRQQDQFEALNNFLLSLDCHKIGIDVSTHYAYFDGLSKALYDTLKEKLDKSITDKFVSSERLGIRYCETRTETELEYWKEVMEVAKEIIEDAFSSDFIKPGVTTCDDVEWHMKETIKSLGLDFWFSPDVNLQNSKSNHPMQNGKTVINKGDLLHCDFGINYLTLKTDTQRLAYILKDGESDIPLDIKEAYKQNLRFHDIVRETFALGESGNEVFAQAIEKAKSEGIKAMLYTHPLGNFGHGPGPTIGLFSNQEAVHPAGDLLIHDCTGYALELNTRKYLETYGKEMFIFTEESVVFKDGQLNYLSQPYEEIYKI